MHLSYACDDWISVEVSVEVSMIKVNITGISHTQQLDFKNISTEFVNY